MEWKVAVDPSGGVQLDPASSNGSPRPRRSATAQNVEWKVFWSLSGPSLVLTTAVIHTAADVGPWVTAVVVGLVWLVAVWAAGRVVNVADMFADLRYEQKETVTTLIRLSVSAHVLLTLVYVVRPSLWPWLALGLIGLGVGIYWGARAEQYVLSRPHRDPVVVGAQGNPLDDDETVKRFRPVLDGAGHPRARIIGHEVVTDEHGVRIANQFLIQTPATGK